MRRSVLVALSALLTAGAVSASTTWYVDDDGGPNADFVDIQSAIDAAQPGDVILVARGVYAGFTLSKGVVIQGSGDAPYSTITSGTTLATGIPQGQVAVVSRLVIRPVLPQFGSTMDAMDVGGVLVLDALEFPYVNNPMYVSSYLRVSSCADVRVIGCETQIGFSVFRSRFEVTSSDVTGSRGYHTCCGGGDGSPAIGATTDSVVRAARSSLTGGMGGYASGPEPIWFGGNGGDGVQVSSGGTVWISGIEADVLQGGAGGYGTCCPACDGVPGRPLRILAGGTARVSGVTVLGSVLGSPVIPSLPDPTLELVGEPQPGQPLTFRVRGPSGSEATLYLGRLPIMVGSGPVGTQLTTRERSYPLGPIPATGFVDFTFPMPAFFQRGFTFFAQGGVLYPAGQERLTNSTPVVLR